VGEACGEVGGRGTIEEGGGERERWALEVFSWGGYTTPPPSEKGGNVGDQGDFTDNENGQQFGDAARYGGRARYGNGAGRWGGDKIPWGRLGASFFSESISGDRIYKEVNRYGRVEKGEKVDGEGPGRKAGCLKKGTRK